MPFIPPTGACRNPSPDRFIDGLRLWTLDHFTPARAVPNMRRPEHYPPLGGEGGDDFLPNHFDVQTSTPIRAMEIVPQSRNQEVCAYHHGRITLGKDGYMQAWMICDQVSEGQSLRRAARLLPFIKREETPGEEIKPRYLYFAGIAQLPKWKTLHYHSTKYYCGIIT